MYILHLSLKMKHPSRAYFLPQIMQTASRTSKSKEGCRKSDRMTVLTTTLCTCSAAYSCCFLFSSSISINICNSFSSFSCASLTSRSCLQNAGKLQVLKKSAVNEKEYRGGFAKRTANIACHTASVKAVMVTVSHCILSKD